MHVCMHRHMKAAFIRLSLIIYKVVRLMEKVLIVSMCVRLPVQRLFGTFLCPKNIYCYSRNALEMSTEPLVGLCVGCPLILSDFNQN